MSADTFELQLQAITTNVVDGRRNTVYGLVNEKTKQPVTVFNDKVVDNALRGIKRFFAKEEDRHALLLETNRLLDISLLMAYVQQIVDKEPALNTEVIENGKVVTYREDTLGGPYLTKQQHALKQMLQPFVPQAVLRMFVEMGVESSEAGYEAAARPTATPNKQTLRCLISRESNHLYVYASAIFVISEEILPK